MPSRNPAASDTADPRAPRPAEPGSAPVDAAVPLPPASAEAIDRFVDALWLEDGLSANTLAAYRRDLQLYARWLAQAGGKALDASTESDLLGYALARHAGTRATSSNRRLTVFKRYFRWALRERRVSADPTLRLSAARQSLRVPKTLSEAQVEALLAAPDAGTPLGLRDRAMLELMYASGLRVSELVTLKTVHVGFSEGALRVTGKGSKERLVPFGEEAHGWLRRCIEGARATQRGGRTRVARFFNGRGAEM
jgi:integrase/recombinase XerD